MAIKATTATANTTRISLWGAAAGQLAAWAVALILGYAAIEQLRDGAAVNSAAPVPNSMISGTKLPRDAYIEASNALASANPKNGWAALARVESAMKGSVGKNDWVRGIEGGLKTEPASARGWLMLAEVLANKKPKMATDALEQSYMLAPKDYWLKRPRTIDALALWPSLDPFTRGLVLEDIRYMWRTPATRSWLLDIVASSTGARIVGQALAPDDIRALNRYISRNALSNK